MKPSSCSKTKNNLLPLDKRNTRRSRHRPNARISILAVTAVLRVADVSVLQGIKNQSWLGAEVLYSEGCKITETFPDWDADNSWYWATLS